MVILKLKNIITKGKKEKNLPDRLNSRMESLEEEFINLKIDQ